MRVMQTRGTQQVGMYHSPASAGIIAGPVGTTTNVVVLHILNVALCRWLRSGATDLVAAAWHSIIVVLVTRNVRITEIDVGHLTRLTSHGFQVCSCSVPV